MSGVRVVELGMWLAGPAAGGILADWGADVVKIEPPKGDPARTFQRMLGGDLPTNPVFELDNRSKRSVVLDLGTEEGRALALELVGNADVFLTNIRMSALRRAGLDPGSLRRSDPRLVYATVSGYGLQGAEADRPAYDIAAYWARSGIAASLTPPGGNLPFQRGGMGDHSVAMTAAAMISAALFARERTGKGDLVSTSLLRQGAYTIGFDVNTALMWGSSINVGTRTAMGNPAINNYTAKDGRRFWIVGLEGERHWPPLARAVGHPEWLDDERFKSPAVRFQNATQLIGLLDEAFATKTLQEWEAVFDSEPDFFWAPVQSIDELLNDPQFHAAGGLIDVPFDEGTWTMLATPADFEAHHAAPRFRAPELGEHTHEVLAELGRSDAEIAALEASGITAAACDTATA
jgi:crotonobetainyl-CoA:carnitine CoA-transferase CaiB-like acyl-CoA transferase